MKKDFSKGIIEKIKENKIKPTQKWKINLKNNLYWLILGTMVLLSGAFLSMVILDLTFFGPETYNFFEFREFFHILLSAAPYLWIFAFIVCVVSGILIFQRTRTGYRYNLLFIVSMILLVASFLGVSAHLSRMNERFESGLLGEGPNPAMMRLKKEGRLFMPEEGVLVGTVIQLGEKTILIKDPLQENWVVEYFEKTKIDRDVDLVVGAKVIILGKKSEGNNFSADGIKRLKRPENRRPNDERMPPPKDEMNREINSRGNVK